VFSPLCSELFHCMSERQVFPAPVLLWLQLNFL
jgi:hypothetical protein